MSRRFGHLVALCAVVLLTACPQTHETKRLDEDEILPLLNASMDDLLGAVRSHADGVRSVNAVTELDPSTGSSYSGVIQDYRDVRAFVLAERGSGGSHLRMIGQAPVVRKTIFDMVADLTGFQISIPPKSKFIVGTNRVVHRSEKPIENLRPQHLFEAFLPVAPAQPGPNVQHYLEENEFGGRRYYLVSEATALEDGDGYAVWHMARKWWFDRTDLSLVRAQSFDSEGRLVTDIHYGDWREVAGQRYPYRIELIRPHDDYHLKLLVKELTLNEGLGADKFELQKPPAAELVDIDALAAEKKAEEDKMPEPPASDMEVLPSTPPVN